MRKDFRRIARSRRRSGVQRAARTFSAMSLVSSRDERARPVTA
jgi:hypothetical protein